MPSYVPYVLAAGINDGAMTIMMMLLCRCCHARTHSPRTRKALTPVPEQLWAVRNVANGFVRFGDQSKVRPGILAALLYLNPCAHNHRCGFHIPSCLPLNLSRACLTCAAYVTHPRPHTFHPFSHKDYVTFTADG